MAKRTSTRKSVAKRSRVSKRRSPERWVRKRMVMDQRKLDAVRKILGVATEKEAIDQALDAIVFGRQLSEGIEAVSRAGGIDDPWGGR